MLIDGLLRAKAEEVFHANQQGTQRYRKLFNRYAYPINEYKFKETDA